MVGKGSLKLILIGDLDGLSPGRRIKRGTVANLKAKIDKVEVKRLNFTSQKSLTPIKKKKRIPVNSTKKDIPDPHQSKINYFFRGVRR